MKALKSAAYKKLESYRDLMNKNRLRVDAKDLSCVVYLGTNKNGFPTAIGYRGRRSKPTFAHAFENVEQRAKYVQEFFKSNYKGTKVFKRSLEVDDDVLVSSWGYDQTNVDYYKVIELVGKSSVKVVEIGSVKEYDRNGDSGTCYPVVDKIIGSPFKKRDGGDGSIRINSYSWARKLEANDGIFKGNYWSSYA